MSTPGDRTITASRQLGQAAEEIASSVIAARGGDPEARLRAIGATRLLAAVLRDEQHELAAVQAERLRALLEASDVIAWTGAVDTGVASLAYEISRLGRTRRSSRFPAQVASARVIVLDRDSTEADALAEQLRAQLVDPVIVDSVEGVLAEVERRQPDAILVGADPESPDQIVLLSRALGRLPVRVPVGVIAPDGLPEHRVAAATAGASLYLERPLTAETIGLALRRLVDTRRGAVPKVLVLDDEADWRTVAGKILHSEGFEVAELGDPRRVFEVLDDFRPDVLLVDATMDHLSGYDVCRMLRTSAQWQELPIVFVTNHTDVESKLAAFRAGADDFVSKSADAEELVARTRGRFERTRLLRDYGDRDFLTGLPRRGAFLAAFLSILNQARRRERPAALAVLDLDHFKEVNDVHGHLAGDRVLIAIGKVLSSSFRAEDVRGRWGGEEFVVAFPDSGAPAVLPALERVLEDVRSLELEGDGGAFQCTFSAGVASFPKDGAGPADLFAAADRRLYIAKRLGRARIVSEG
ncbi:MAG: diguanylate cyclase [Deltaproteobacteria bacterium]|nr:diguanylate cyclase [Deltaproteobacteria bacterium]